MKIDFLVLRLLKRDPWMSQRKGKSTEGPYLTTGNKNE